jgi:hypothetical protein
MSCLGRLSFSRGLGTYRSYRTPQNGVRAFASTEHQSPVLSQLRRVADLQQRVSAENSKTRKQDIMAEYPDLRNLLEM